MNCPEAVEWMHRYIDHDLNQEERFLLFEHIRTCDECAEKFELLNRLSAQLEDLPDVTPKYSLVDAILPQLEVIDQARKEEGSTIEEMTLLLGTGTVPLTGDGPSRYRRLNATKRRQRIYRFGALGLTAALFLGVFIYYGLGTGPSSTDMIALSTADNASSANQSELSEPAADNAEPFSEQNKSNSMNNDDVHSFLMEAPSAVDPSTTERAAEEETTSSNQVGLTDITSPPQGTSPEESSSNLPLPNDDQAIGNESVPSPDQSVQDMSPQAPLEVGEGDPVASLRVPLESNTNQDGSTEALPSGNDGVMSGD